MKDRFIALFYVLLPVRVADVVLKIFFTPFAEVTYSLEGEDIVLSRLFLGKKEGVYVDIGAHHPFRYSNTYKFYRRGWRGINIDAMPGSMSKFNAYRKRDINVESLIAKEQGKTKFYVFSDPALNTINRELAFQRDSETPYKIIKTLELETKTLGQILDENLPENMQIDFMSIDVESMDLEVLESNNWEKYIPTVIAVESSDGDGSLHSLEDNLLYKFLLSKGYLLVSKLSNTLIFSSKQGHI